MEKKQLDEPPSANSTLNQILLQLRRIELKLLLHENHKENERAPGIVHQKILKLYFSLNVNSSPLYCLEQCLKFQENHTYSFWTTRPSVGMAGTWYLINYFLSSANISLSIHKNEKITRTVPLLKSNST